MTHARREFIKGLRAVADFYEQNPRAYYDGMHLTLNMYLGGREARSTLAEMAGIFGRCDQTYDDRTISLSRSFSEQITLVIFVLRDRVRRRLVTRRRILSANTLAQTPANDA